MSLRSLQHLPAASAAAPPPSLPPPAPPVPLSLPAATSSRPRPKITRQQSESQPPSPPHSPAPKAASMREFPAGNTLIQKVPSDFDLTALSRKSVDTRRASLSSLSLNRFSLSSSKKPKRPVEPEPPLPPPKPTPSKRKPHEIRATVTNSRGAQRRTSGLERRVSNSKTGAITPPLRSPTRMANSPGRTPTRVSPTAATFPSPLESMPHEEKLPTPSSPTLNKKRSFFRRMADKLTRSRTNLREDAKETTKASAPIPPAAPPAEPMHEEETPPTPLESDPRMMQRSRAASLSHLPPQCPPPSASLPPTPTSSKTRKTRPPSIKVPGSRSRSNTVVLTDDSQATIPDGDGLRSPTRIPLPPSPAISSLLASSPRAPTHGLLTADTSALPTPTTPKRTTSLAYATLNRKMSAPNLSPTRPPLPSPVDTRTPLPSPHGLQFPLPPMGQPASPTQMALLERRTRSGSDARSLRGEEPRVSNLVAALNANLHVSTHPRTDSAKLAELAKADADAEFRRAREREECANGNRRSGDSGQRDSHIIVDFLEELGMGDIGRNGRPRVEEVKNVREEHMRGDSEISMLQRSAGSTPRQEAHARADSHTLGALLQGMQASPKAHGHARADSQTLPPGSHKPSWQIQMGDVEMMGDLPNMGVNQWLTNGKPKLERSESVSSSGKASNYTTGSSSFTKDLAFLEAWRERLQEGEDEDEEIMPEVEKMALEVEERMRREGKLSDRHSSKKKRESRNFFSRKSTRSDAVPVLSSPRVPKASKNSSFLPSSSASSNSFLPTSPSSPRYPVARSSSPGSPGPMRKAVNPRMHTGASILLETENIADPEAKRLSEAMFLS